MRLLIINLLTFLRTMNKNKNKKKTTKRVEKVDDADDVVLEEKEYLLQPLRYLPQRLRRRRTQTTYKPNIPPQILLQTSPRIRAQKRLACSIPLTVFTARADAVLRPPCPQGRSPSLWEGRGRFWGGTRLILKSRDGFLPSFGGIGRDFPIGAGLQSQPLCRTISTIPRINLSHFTRRYSLHWQ